MPNMIKMEMSSKENLRIYVLINTTANMSVGKSVVQAAHGVETMTETLLLRHRKTWRSYKNSGCAKIALGCPAHLLRTLHDKYNEQPKDLQKNPIRCTEVIDAGLTEVKTGTTTALVFFPMRRCDAPEEFELLKLMKA